MKPSQALEMNREAIRAAVARHKAANPRVFGSVLRGEDTEGSDLGILIEALPGATLFDLGGLYNELEALLSVPISLVTPDELPVNWRHRVLEEARPV
ncbi:MAG: nucleotidyltransferase family protein [Alphaproteobacteria bacterium]|nr:nucleotidyltransferase family protein [Alphaproteobacteria bacterium]